jgi:hypothetical protein
MARVQFPLHAGLPRAYASRPVRNAHCARTIRGSLSIREAPEPFRFHLRARMRSSVRASVPAWRIRCSHFNPCIEALRDRTIWSGISPPDRRVPGKAEGRASGEGCRHRVWSGRNVGCARSRRVGLSRDGFRGNRGAGRHDAAWHPGIQATSRCPSGPDPGNSRSGTRTSIE